jgi:hypothetical protein
LSTGDFLRDLFGLFQISLQRRRVGGESKRKQAGKGREKTKPKKHNMKKKKKKKPSKIHCTD